MPPDMLMEMPPDSLMEMPPDRLITFWSSAKPNFIVNVHFHRLYAYKFWLENKILIISIFF